MLKNKILEKLLAIILIFTLTSANFAFVTKSYASSFAETLFGSKSDTGHKNIGFEAYFGTEEEKETSVISDVNNEELAISMKVNVQKGGYLKDAKIEIAETEEGKGLNFEVKDFKAEVTKLEDTKEPAEETSDETESNTTEVNEVENTEIETDKTEPENQEDSEETKSEEQEIKDEKELEESSSELTEIELPKYVQSLEDNIIKLQQINSSSEASISLPIEYKNEEYVNEQKFSNDALIKFSGIYVDDDGDETEVSREIKLNVSWKDERKVDVQTEVTKFIDFGRGVILQTLVKVDSSTDKKTLPVKESEIAIEIPKFEEAIPSNITVVANSTAGTNGETAGTLKFDENNWEYNQEENKLILKANNEKKLVVVNEYEDEYLKDSDKELIEEERYFNKSGVDEYLITYTFENAKIESGVTKSSSNIDAKVVTFSGVLQDNNINISESNNAYEYSLEGETGNIVSLNIENETAEVSKAYAYANYDNSEKYEVEFNSKTIVNVSYKEIVEMISVEDEPNLYVDKSGNAFENNDLYYKQISISKEDFLNILGENGEIRVLDLDRNVIATINNETEVNEDGKVIVSFDQKHSRLVFETTKPVGEGNLVIQNVKAMKNAGIDKPSFANLSEIKMGAKIKANYTYVSETVEVGTSEIKTDLIDTITKANLVMDRDTLSTLAENDEVELRVELNNATDKSDIYGNSVFEVELPEYVESLSVTNVSLLYGEGLEIVSAEQIDRIIRITIDGKQEGINSGVLTNGTNIVINANIKVNLYAPAKLDIIKLRYNNSQATNYIDDGYRELAFMYSAPTGLVAVNSVSNYNNAGAVITSVRQGMKEDVIDIYSEAKTSTMEIIVMNNNSNTVSEVSILGRIPFKGVKDIETGEDLGTTLNTKLVSTIMPDAHNTTLFNVYYSENGEATKDLEDSSNGWTLTPESLDNIKSYLIVPVDKDYIMQNAEILRFTYQYEIPANLTHNENIYGTFLAYYTNNSEVATTEEKATPDKVGLTTGEGPEVKIEVSSNKEVIREYEELQVNIVATNVGNTRAENVNVEFPIPKFSKYVSYETDNQDVTITEENGIIRASKPTLEKEEKIEFKVNLKADGIPSIEEYYRGIEGFGEYDGLYKIVSEDENGNVKEEVITSVPDVYIEPKASVSAKELGATLTAEASKVKVTEAEFEITLANKSDIDGDLDVQKTGDEVKFTLGVTNLTEKVMKNVTVTQVLPQEFGFVKAAVIGYESDGLTSKEVAQGTYDENTRTITWNINELEEDGYVNLIFVIKVNEIGESITKKDVEVTAKVSAEGTNIYESNSVLTMIGRPVLVITQITENTDTYIKEGDTVKYVFTVKNEGEAVAEHVKLTDVIPDGIAVRKITYVSDGIVGKKKVSSSREAVIMANIKPKEELVVNIEAVASNLGGVQEKTVTNFATVSSEEIEERETNSITHIVEASEKSIVASKLQSSSSSSASGTNTNIAKTYKLTGTAWLDSNKDGMRSIGEELLTGIVVRLVNSETGVIQNSTTTDSNGTYTFSGITNGNYLVIFEYDTVKYTVTSYKKDGVEINVNSDAITTKLEQDGRTRNGAITDVITIANGSVSGIDIGLVLADTFDLKLDKAITKVTTQSAKGTVTDEYNNVKFAKTEVAAKHLSGATVYVEYAITVSNIGDVSGYAKKIIDYMPEGMTFNSSLEANSDWYTGSDGNLYSTALANRELKTGESATLKLVLTKQMTTENTGLVNNLAEVYEDYNIYGISDTNSVPANKAQGENDLGLADIAILIKTGESFIYVSVIITTILLGSIVIFIAYNKIVLGKRKGGV